MTMKFTLKTSFSADGKLNKHAGIYTVVIIQMKLL